MRRWTVIVLPLIVASAAACGSNDATVGPEHAQPADQATATALTISVTAKPGAKPQEWTLKCDPPGGSLPKAKQACATLSKVKTPFAATPKNQMCTQIMGGPEQAKISGTWQGTKVTSTFSKKNGCEIKRWNDIKPVLNHKT